MLVTAYYVVLQRITVLVTAYYVVLQYIIMLVTSYNVVITVYNGCSPNPCYGSNSTCTSYRNHTYFCQCGLYTPITNIVNCGMYFF